MSESGSSSTPPFSLLKDRYEVHTLINKGGMGQVYRGFDRVLQRKVAVKILSDIDSREMFQRFEREAKTLSQLNHPNLSTIYDYGVEGKQPFMVMGLIDGVSLEAWISKASKLDLSKKLDWIEQIGEGLAYAHDQGVVHRDIKPENILISQMSGKEKITIVDFGLAISDYQNTNQTRLTSPDTILGTHRYMPPEQMEGSPATPATDIYAFGLVVAELLGGAASVTAGRLRTSFHPESSLSPYWPVLQKACTEEPEKRWPHIRSMIKALREASPSIPQMAQKTSLNPKPLLLLFGLLALGLLISTGLFFYKKNPSSQGNIPIISIRKISLEWSSPNQLEVRISGNARSEHPQRLILEAAVCDLDGTRIPSEKSGLVDQSLGKIMALDLLQTSQPIEKNFLLSIPQDVPEGYLSITIFNGNEWIVVQQNSAFWPPRTSNLP